MSVVVLPGDIVNVEKRNQSIKLGPGLIQTDAIPSIVAVRAGVLHNHSNSWWIDSNAARYVPSAQEPVIGIITHRHADGYRVDIGSAHSASLDALAFEGASKRNRPNLKVRQIIYARVSLAHKDMEPELECFDASTHKAGDFGELKGGYLITCSLGTCRSLLTPTHPLLPHLGTLLPFDIVVAINGRVWIKSELARHTIGVARVIEAVDEDPSLAFDQGRLDKLVAELRI